MLYAWCGSSPHFSKWSKLCSTQKIERRHCIAILPAPCTPRCTQKAGGQRFMSASDDSCFHRSSDSSMSATHLPATSHPSPMTRHVSKYHGVVVGGTFDRLHDGHRLLLRTAVQVVTPGGLLVVGISTAVLLQNKYLAELIEPYETRAGGVEDFVSVCGDGPSPPNLRVQVVPITEAAPARGSTDPSLDCVVVSSETEAGAHKLNEARRKNGVGVLEVVVIDTVDRKMQNGSEDIGDAKLSSSQLRHRDLAKYHPRRDRERHTSSPLRCPPFMIGLTGGIACGKSSVCNMLRHKGAAVIDCDSLAHRSYEIGTPIYHALIEEFGPIIRKQDGSIDRPALGGIVFSDPGKMRRLTGIVWPAVRHLLVEQREALGQAGIHICVAEAALMLEAGSDAEMDEVWVVFAGEGVVKQRLRERNGWSEDEVEKRIRSQMSGAERVSRGDLLIYNGGSVEETGVQLEEAWGRVVERAVPRVATWQQARGGRHPMWVRWVGLMGRVGLGEEDTRRWWDRLEGRGLGWEYRTKMYEEYHKYAHFVSEPAVVQLAIFFHEADAAQGEGEGEGKEMFAHFATDISLSALLVAKVQASVMAGGGGEMGVLSGDSAWFQDLRTAALLDWSKEEFEEKVDNFGSENRKMEGGDKEGEEPRVAELQLLFDKHELFLTKRMREDLEEKVREHLGHYLHSKEVCKKN